MTCTTVTKLRTGRTSSHTIKVCIVSTNCICTYAAFDICVCTRGIVYELFHTHLTKHHIICDRLPQLIHSFCSQSISSRVVMNTFLPCHLTSTTISVHIDETQIMWIWCFYLHCFCLLLVYLERYQISFNNLVSFVIFALCVLDFHVYHRMWTYQYHVSCHHQKQSHFLSFVTLNLFDTSIKILYQSRYIVI